MAVSLQDYHGWLTRNPHKMGTPNYETIKRGYETLLAEASEYEEPRPARKKRPAKSKPFDFSILEREVPEYVPPVDNRGTFRKGISRGIDQAGLMAGSALEGIGSLLGSEYLMQAGREQIAENEQQLAEIGPGVTWDEAQGISGVLDWATGTLGETLPLTATSVIAGIGGAAAAPAGAAAAIAGVGAAAASQLPFFYGGNRERQKEAIEQGLRTEISEAAAAITALPQATLDAVAERFQLHLLTKGMKYVPKALKAKKKTVDGVTEIQLGKEGLFTRAAKGTGKGVIAEVPTEVGQSLLERIQAGMDPLSEEALAEYVDTARAAGLIGGVIGGGAGAAGVNSARSQREAIEIERIAKRNDAIAEIMADAENKSDAEKAKLDAQIKEYVANDEAENLTKVLKEHNYEIPQNDSGRLEIDGHIVDWKDGKIIPTRPTEEPTGELEGEPESEVTKEMLDKVSPDPYDEEQTRLDTEYRTAQEEEERQREENFEGIETAREAGIAAIYAQQQEQKNRELIGSPYEVPPDEAVEVLPEIPEISAADEIEAILQESSTRNMLRILEQQDRRRTEAARIAGREEEVASAGIVEPESEPLEFPAEGTPETAMAIAMREAEARRRGGEPPTDNEPPTGGIPPVPGGTPPVVPPVVPPVIPGVGVPPGRTAPDENQSRLEVPPLIPTSDDTVTPSEGITFFSDKALKQARAEIRNPASRETVVMMSPEDFLSLAEQGVSEAKTKNVADILKSGKGFDSIPLIKFDNFGDIAKVVGHEGRHRARALLGVVEKMPVKLISGEGGDARAIRWGSQQADNPDFVALPKSLVAQKSDTSVPFPIQDAGTHFNAALDFVTEKEEGRTASKNNQGTPLKGNVTSFLNGEAVLAALNARKERVKPKAKAKPKAKPKVNIPLTVPQDPISNLGGPKKLGGQVTQADRKVIAAVILDNVVGETTDAGIAAGYFGKGRPTPEDALIQLGWELANGTAGYVQHAAEPAKYNEFLQHSGGTRVDKKGNPLEKSYAAKFKRWVDNNLSQQARDALDKYIEVERQVKRDRNKGLTVTKKKQMIRDADVDAPTIPYQERVAIAQTDATPHTIPVALWEKGRTQKDIQELADAFKRDEAQQQAAAELAGVRQKQNLSKKQRGKEKQARAAYALRRKLQDIQEAKRDDPLSLWVDAVSETTQSLHPVARGLLAENDLSGALYVMASTSRSKDLVKLASKLRGKLGDTKVTLVSGLKNAAGKNVAGLFDPKTNTVQLDRELGLNNHTLLHEVTHALVSDTLSNPRNATTIQLQKLYDVTKDLLDTAYGAQSLDEFVAEAFSNNNFRQKLARLNPEGKELSALQRFANIIIKLFNRIGFDTALSRTEDLATGILAPAPEYRNSGQLAAMSLADGVKKVMEGIGAVQKANNSIGPPDIDTWSDDATEFLDTAHETGRKALLAFVDMLRVGDLAEKHGLGDIGRRLHIIAEEGRGDHHKADVRVTKRLKWLQAWQRANEKRNGKEVMNRIMYSMKYGSTLYQADPSLSEEEAEEAYAADPDKMQAWRDQQPDWNKLKTMYGTGGMSGADLYLEIQRGVYKHDYVALRDIIEGRLTELLGEDDEDFKSLKENVFTKMFSDGELNTYFPLTREGRYKVGYNLVEGTEAAIAAAAVSGDNYVMQMGGTKSGAQRLKKLLEADSEVVPGSIQIVDTQDEIHNYRNQVPATSFVSKFLKELEGKTLKGVHPSVVKDVRNSILALFIDSLPETSFAQSLRKRKNTPGFIDVAEDALRTKGYDIARQAARMRTAARVTGIETELQGMKYNDLSAADQGKIKRANFEAVRRELLERAQFIRNPPHDIWPKRLNQMAFVYTIGFNASSALVNLSQIPLFVMPYLGAKFGYENTRVAIFTAASLVLGSRRGANVGMDHYYDVDDDGMFTLRENLSTKKKEQLKDLTPLLQRMSDRGLLNEAGFLKDNLNLEEASRKHKGNKLAEIADAITSASAIMFNTAERFNRQSTTIAAYILELKEARRKNVGPLNEEQLLKIADDAMHSAQESNGGAFLETAPRITQKGLGRVAFMYKGYGLRMYDTMFKAGMAVIDKEVPADKRIEAGKQLIGWHLTSLFFAGVQGIPLYGAAKLIADGLFYEDDEEDWDTRVRNLVSEGWYKGPLNELLDMDVASRVRLSQLLIQDNRYNAKPSPEESLFYHAGGPALSTAKRIHRGYEDLTEGNIQRGFESFLPPAVANMWKAVDRVRKEGYVTRRYDPIYDDVTDGELAGQFFGFAPTEYVRRQEETMIIKKIDNNVNKLRSDLARKYYISMRIGDTETQEKVHDKIVKFNERHPAAGIDPTFMKRSMKAHIATSAKSHNGVVYSDLMEKMLADYSWPDPN